jgi:hypothetical protein
VFRICIANSIQSNRVYREIRNYQLVRARSLVGTWRRVDDAQLISNRRAPVWRFVGSGSSSANRLCRLQVQLGNGAVAAPVQSWAVIKATRGFRRPEGSIKAIKAARRAIGTEHEQTVFFLFFYQGIRIDSSPGTNRASFACVTWFVSGFLSWAFLSLARAFPAQDTGYPIFF